MSWRNEWIAISQVIDELANICTDYLNAVSGKGSDDAANRQTIIRPMAQSLLNKIRSFSERYAEQLPDLANDCLDSYLESLPTQIGFLSASSSVNKGASATIKFALLFREFRAEFNYLISDLDATAIRLTARAFTHLQRSITADPDIKKKWKGGFESGEVACEKLGSVHLLQHGIWCFKTSGNGEATDLVLCEPINSFLGDIDRAAEGLVLTEWKLVRDPKKADDGYRQALKQAERYGKGLLASIELKYYRYLVIVSKDYLDGLPGDFEKDGVRYKYINIAVDPSPPSKPVRTKN